MKKVASLALTIQRYCQGIVIMCIPFICMCVGLPSWVCVVCGLVVFWLYVLFKNNFDFRLHTVIRDDEGKYIILDIEMLGKRMTLVNLYAPSSGDHPEYFEKNEKDIDKIANNYILIGGDWNLFLNPALDSSRYRAVNRPRARKKVYDLMLKYDLIDSWRELYPEKKKYPWRRFKSFVQGRLDYFLLSQALNVQVKNANISPG